MATQIIKTVGSGGDYASLSAALAAIPASLVTADEQWELRVLAGELAMTAPIDFGTKTQNATCFIHLTAAPGAGFAATSSNPLRYGYGARLLWTDGSDTTFTWLGVLRLGHYGRLSGLQIRHSSWNGVVDAVVSGSSNCRISGCLIERAQYVDTGSIVAFHSDGNSLSNSVIALSGSSGATASAIMGRASTADVTAANAVINNVIIRTADQSGGIAIRAGEIPGSLLASDNVVVGSWGAAVQADFANRWATGSGRLVSSLADGSGVNAAPGSGNTFSITTANLLTSIASSAALDARLKSGFTSYPGQRNQTYTNDLDIFGQARSTTAPQIGAQETLAAIGTATPLSSTPAVAAIAASGTAAFTGITRQFQMTFYQEDRSTPAAGVTGIHGAWWPSIAASRTQAPSVSWTGLSTNGSGQVTMAAASGLSIGTNQGFGYLSNQDATPDSSEVAYIGSFDVI